MAIWSSAFLIFTRQHRSTNDLADLPGQLQRAALCHETSFSKLGPNFEHGWGNSCPLLLGRVLSRMIRSIFQCKLNHVREDLVGSARWMPQTSSVSRLRSAHLLRNMIADGDRGRKAAIKRPIQIQHEQIQYKFGVSYVTQSESLKKTTSLTRL